MEGNCQHFIAKKKKKKGKILQQLSLTTLLERDKNTLQCLYVEHLLQLIGDVMRQWSRDLNVVYNHNKA
jgi:hypothetical protein